MTRPTLNFTVGRGVKADARARDRLVLDRLPRLLPEIGVVAREAHEVAEGAEVEDRLDAGPQVEHGERRELRPQLQPLGGGRERVRDPDREMGVGQERVLRLRQAPSPARAELVLEADGVHRGAERVGRGGVRRPRAVGEAADRRSGGESCQYHRRAHGWTLSGVIVFTPPRPARRALHYGIAAVTI